MKHHLFGVGAILCAILLAAFVYWPVAQPAPAYIDLYPELVWEEGGSAATLQAYYCPLAVGENCTSAEEQVIELPANAKVYTAIVEHPVPIDLRAEDRSEYNAFWRRQEHVRSFFATEMRVRGYYADDAPLYALSDGYFDHFTAEKPGIITDVYGRVRDGMYQQIVVKSSIRDHSDCPAERKNIFDECNTIVAEYYVVTVGEPVPLETLLNKE